MSAHKGFINRAVVAQAWVCFEISLSLSKMLSIPRGLLNLFFSLSDREISKQNRACVTTAWLVKPLCALIILLSVQKNLQAESRPRSPLIKPLRALIILPSRFTPPFLLRCRQPVPVTSPGHPGKWASRANFDGHVERKKKKHSLFQKTETHIPLSQTPTYPPTSRPPPLNHQLPSRWPSPNHQLKKAGGRDLTTSPIQSWWPGRWPGGRRTHG